MLLGRDVKIHTPTNEFKDVCFSENFNAKHNTTHQCVSHDIILYSVLTPRSTHNSKSSIPLLQKDRNSIETLALALRSKIICGKYLD